MKFAKWWPSIATAGGVVGWIALVGVIWSRSRRADPALKGAWRAKLNVQLGELLAVPLQDGSWSLQPWDDPSLGGYTGLHAVGAVRARGLTPLLLSDWSKIVGATAAEARRLHATEARPGVTYVMVPENLSVPWNLVIP